MPGQKLVLIVEDDRLIRLLSAELLLEAGVGILDAADGEEAVELLEQRATEIAAVITDVRMPGGCSGLDLAQRVTERWPWISILVTSGHFLERPPGLPQKAQFLRKPWKPEKLLDFASWAARSDVR
jgi:DNA-binding NtrC family response regulator